MSAPITKTRSSNSIEKQDGDVPLPVIDILSFRVPNENKKKANRETVKRPPKTAPHNVSMFKASNFGIDGSYPPLITSWSCRTLYRAPRSSRTRLSRTKSEPSLVLEDIQEIPKSRSGFSSPCFKGSVTPARYRHLSYTSSTLHKQPPGEMGNENFFISKANLNKRPKKKLLTIKTDYNGNVTSISDHKSESANDFRRSTDEGLRSSSKQANDRECDQSELWFYRPSESILDNYKDEYTSDYSSREVYLARNTQVKKINIKLPF